MTYTRPGELILQHNRQSVKKIIQKNSILNKLVICRASIGTVAGICVYYTQLASSRHTLLNIILYAIISNMHNIVVVDNPKYDHYPSIPFGRGHKGKK